MIQTNDNQDLIDQLFQENANIYQEIIQLRESSNSSIIKTDIESVQQFKIFVLRSQVQQCSPEAIYLSMMKKKYYMKNFQTKQVKFNSVLLSKNRLNYLLKKIHIVLRNSSIELTSLTNYGMTLLYQDIRDSQMRERTASILQASADI
jgi:hypothetical protein